MQLLDYTNFILQLVTPFYWFKTFIRSALWRQFMPLKTWYLHNSFAKIFGFTASHTEKLSPSTNSLFLFFIIIKRSVQLDDYVSWLLFWTSPITNQYWHSASQGSQFWLLEPARILQFRQAGQYSEDGWKQRTHWYVMIKTEQNRHKEHYNNHSKFCKYKKSVSVNKALR